MQHSVQFNLPPPESSPPGQAEGETDSDDQLEALAREHLDDMRGSPERQKLLDDVQALTADLLSFHSEMVFCEQALEVLEAPASLTQMYEAAQEFVSSSQSGPSGKTSSDGKRSHKWYDHPWSGESAKPTELPHGVEWLMQSFLENSSNAVSAISTINVFEHNMLDYVDSEREKHYEDVYNHFRAWYLTVRKLAPDLGLGIGHDDWLTSDSYACFTEEWQWAEYLNAANPYINEEASRAWEQLSECRSALLEAATRVLPMDTRHRFSQQRLQCDDNWCTADILFSSAIKSAWRKEHRGETEGGAPQLITHSPIGSMDRETRRILARLQRTNLPDSVRELVSLIGPPAMAPPLENAWVRFAESLTLLKRPSLQKELIVVEAEVDRTMMEAPNMRVSWLEGVKKVAHPEDSGRGVTFWKTKTLSTRQLILGKVYDEAKRKANHDIDEEELSQILSRMRKSIRKSLEDLDDGKFLAPPLSDIASILPFDVTYSTLDHPE